MLDGNNESPRTVHEEYAGAVSDGATRVQAHRTTRADLIASAGMSQYSTGTALMRLVSEWNSGAVPKERGVPDAKALAQEATKARVDRGIQAAEEEFGPMKVSDKMGLRARAPVTKHEREFAQAEQRRLEAQATDWNLEEAKLRFQRLKTLPTVRAALIFWVRDRGWDDAEYLVAKVLQYYLSPYCPACGGSGVREFAGNDKRSAGKPCPKCMARRREGIVCAMGELPIPCHGRGKALLAHIISCRARAGKDVGEGAWRRSRSAQSEEDRARQKHYQEVEKLRRADAEAKADEAQDNAAVAQRFKESMGARRRR